MVKRGVEAIEADLLRAGASSTWPTWSSASALFTAMNKDTQALHHEVVAVRSGGGAGALRQGRRHHPRRRAGELPPRIADEPDFYLCRFCPYAPRCWEGDA